MKPTDGMAVLHGNLAPGGAVTKYATATADDVLVLQNGGPKGAAGMPAAGYLPIPRKLAQAGVNDMVRISDARMSGAAFGTIVLHIKPESAVGDPLGFVRTGDQIWLNVAARRINVLLDDAELARRQTAAPASRPGLSRGYVKLFHDTVTQTDQGSDFDFLIGRDERE